MIEVGIALAIMLVIGVSIASLFVYAIKYNMGANDRAMAQAIAQQRMEYLRKSSFAEVADATETVTMGGHSFTVTTTVCNDGTVACGGGANSKRVTLTVTPLNGGGGWANQAVRIISLRGSTSLGPYF